MPGRIDVGSRMHAHLGDGIIGPAGKIGGKQPEWQAEQAHKQPRSAVAFMFDLYLHKERVVPVETDRLRQVDDSHSPGPSSSTIRLVKLPMRPIPIAMRILMPFA